MLWGGRRIEIGSLFSAGRTLFKQVLPGLAAAWRHLQLVVTWRSGVHGDINKVIPGMVDSTIPE